MSAPTAILLVPAEGDPHGLLAEGVCGARPPKAIRIPCPKHGISWRSSAERPCCLHGGILIMARETTDALVLAWDGKPVVEGLDRYTRATGGYRWDSGVDFPSMDMSTIVVAWGEQVRRLGLGTLVLLDPTGAVIP